MWHGYHSPESGAQTHEIRKLISEAVRRAAWSLGGAVTLAYLVDQNFYVGIHFERISYSTLHDSSQDSDADLTQKLSLSSIGAVFIWSPSADGP